MPMIHEPCVFAHSSHGRKKPQHAGAFLGGTVPAPFTVSTRNRYPNICGRAENDSTAKIDSTVAATNPAFGISASHCRANVQSNHNRASHNYQKCCQRGSPPAGRAPASKTSPSHS